MKQSPVSDTIWTSLEKLEHLQQTLESERKKVWNNPIIAALGFSRRRKQQIERLEMQVASAETEFRALQKKFVSAVSDRARAALQSCSVITSSASDEPRLDTLTSPENFSHVAGRAASLGAAEMDKCTSVALRRLERGRIPELQASRKHPLAKGTGK